MKFPLRFLVCLASLSVLHPGAAQTTKVWNGSASSDWFNPSNWAPAGVPAPNDTVNFTNGTINLTAPVTISGQFNWAGGVIQGNGLTIAASGVLNLLSSGVLDLRAALTNAGTVNGLGGGINLDNYSGGVGPIINLAGGLWNIQSDQGIGAIYAGGGNNFFQNLGTLQKSGGTNTTGIYIPFYNSGLVTVLQGTFEVDNGGPIDGSYQTTNGTAIRFNGGNFSPGNSPSISGGGITEFTGGGLLLPSNTIPNLAMVGGTVTLGTNFQSGTITNLILTGSTLSGNYSVSGVLSCANGWSGNMRVAAGGQFNWSGGPGSGSLTIAASGVLNLLSSGTLSLQAALTNAGTVNGLGGGINLNNYFGGVGPIINLAGGVWNIQSDQSIGFVSGGGANNFFQNMGTVQKSGGTNTTGIYIPFYNSGLVTVLQGTLELDNGGTIDGSYQTTNGTAIRFNGGNFTLGNAPSISGAGIAEFTGGSLLLPSNTIPNLPLVGGTVSLGTNFQGGTITNLILTGSTLSGNYTVSGVLSCANGWSGNMQVAAGGQFNWSGGAGSGSLTIAASGVLNLLSSGTLSLQAALTNAGTVNELGGGINLNNYFGGVGPIINLASGVWNIQSDQGIGAVSGGGANNFFQNLGTVQKSGGTNVTGIYIPFNNLGLVRVLQGSLVLGSGGALGGTYDAGLDRSVLLTGGNFTVGEQPLIPLPYSVQLTGGNLLLTNDTLSRVRLAGGSVTLGPGFQGGVITNLTLEGTTLSGDYTVAGRFISGNGWSGNLRIAPGGMVDWSGGNVYGSLNISSNGILNLAGSWINFLQGTITNAGRVNWQSGQLNLYYGPNCNNSTGPIVNLPGGLWDIQCDQAVGYNCGVGATAFFQNLGTVQKSAGTNTTGLYIPFLNSGRVDVLSGTFELDNGGTIDGSYQATNGTAIRFNGGNFTQGNAPAISGGGLTEFSGGGLVLTSTTVPNLLMVGGTLTLGTNFQGGSITNLPLAGTFLQGSYTVSGLLDCPNGWSGDLRVAAGGILNWGGGTAYGSVNIASSGIVNLVGGGGYMQLQGTFTNAGTVNWLSGQLNLYHGPNCNAGAGPIVNLADGLWDIQCDQALGYNCGVDANSFFENLGMMRKSGGTTSGGFYIPFINAGTLGLESGTLLIDHGYTSVDGGLQFGLRSLTDFGRLKITGNITFDGNLSLQLLAGFVPAISNSFPLITYGSSSGLFTNLDAPAGATWQTNYQGNAFVVSVANISKLVFSTQPTNGLAGAALPSLSVQIQDVNGNSIPTNGVPISISLASGNGSLLGTLTQPTDSSGKAVFADLSINLSGVKTLSVAAPGAWLTPATSVAFSIGPGSAARLALLSPLPPAQASGAPFAPPLVARVVDAFGNPVFGSTARINLSSSSTGSGSFSGATGVSADGITGSAAFTNVVYNLGNPAQAESVSLYFTSPGLTALTNTILVGTAMPSIVLSNLNSTATIDTTSDQGLFSWTVEGIDQVFQHWFWFAIGSNMAPVSLDHLGTAWSVARSTTNAAVSFVSAGVSVQLGFSLQGGTPGSYSSGLTERVSIQNLSNAPVVIHFYEYSDFDLAAQALGDVISTNAPGAFTQTGKGMTLTTASGPPAPSHWEAALYDSTLLALKNGLPVVLDDAVFPALPGDQVYAVQWDISLAPRQAASINLTKTLAPAPVAMTISSVGTNVVVSWPTNSLTGLSLRAGTISEPVTSWQTLTNVPEVLGQSYQVKLPPSFGSQSFRLLK